MAEDVLTCARKCATDQKLMELYYQKKNGIRNRYELEPYEIKDGFLWGWDSKGGSIKRFALNGVLLPAVMEKDWDVPEGHERSSWPRKLAHDYEEEGNENADKNQGGSEDNGSAEDTRASICSGDDGGTD